MLLLVSYIGCPEGKFSCPNFNDTEADCIPPDMVCDEYCDCDTCEDEQRCSRDRPEKPGSTKLLKIDIVNTISNEEMFVKSQYKFSQLVNHQCFFNWLTNNAKTNKFSGKYLIFFSRNYGDKPVY